MDMHAQYAFEAKPRHTKPSVRESLSQLMCVVSTHAPARCMCRSSHSQLEFKFAHAQIYTLNL
jgi:hypothetical protein